jgi:iron complex outermembrane receptor protein
VGLFFIDQEVKIDGTEESGNAQWRFSQSFMPVHQDELSGT